MQTLSHLNVHMQHTPSLPPPPYNCVLWKALILEFSGNLSGLEPTTCLPVPKQYRLYISEKGMEYLLWHFAAEVCSDLSFLSFCVGEHKETAGPDSDKLSST